MANKNKYRAFEVRLEKLPTGKITKKPAISDWQKAFSSEDEILAWKNQGYMVTHNRVVFDLDPDELGIVPLQNEIQRTLDCQLDWEGALLQNTPSGGSHYVFTIPDGVIIPQGTDISGVEGFDIRSEGKGFIASGEGYTHKAKHPIYKLFNGHGKDLPSLPDEAIKKLGGGVRETEDDLEIIIHNTTKVTNPDGSPLSTRQVRDYLDQLPPRYFLDQDLWKSVGFCVHHQSSGSEKGWKLFDWFSKKAVAHDPEKYDRDANRKRWNSFAHDDSTKAMTFASIIKWVKEAEAGEAIDAEDVGSVFDAIVDEAEVEEVESDDILTDLRSGVFADIVRLCRDMSYTENARMDLLAALSLVSALNDNHFLIDGRTPLQPYLLIGAATGSGKDSRLNFAFNICNKMEFTPINFVGEFASSQAIRKKLSLGQVNTVMDELGLVLAQREKDASKVAMTIELLKFFGKGNTPVAAKAYADEKNDVEKIPCAPLSIIGATTNETLVQAVDEVDAESGYLNRFIYLNCGRSDFRKGRPINDIPAHVKRKLIALYNKTHITVFGEEDSEEEENAKLLRGKILFTDAALKMAEDNREKEFYIFNPKKGKPIKSANIWGRYAQNIEIIAGLLALCEDSVPPTINEYHMRFAKTLVDTGKNDLVEIAETVKETDYSRMTERVYQFIREAKKKKHDRYDSLLQKGHMPYAMIKNYFRNLDNRQLESVLEGLKVSERIIMISNEGSRSKIICYAAGKSKNMPKFC